MENAAALAANDPESKERISDDNELYELTFTAEDLNSLVCALEDTLSRPVTKYGCFWTHKGIEDTAALLKRLSILCNGEASYPTPWTAKQRLEWQKASAAVQRILNLPARTAQEAQAPL